MQEELSKYFLKIIPFMRLKIQLVSTNVLVETSINCRLSRIYPGRKGVFFVINWINTGEINHVQIRPSSSIQVFC